MEFSVINEAANSPSNSRIVSIILAENGTLHESPYIKFVSPIGVKRAPFLIDFIDKEYGIAKANQLILRAEDGKQLDPSASLEEFFQKDRTLFVYTTKGPSKEVNQDDFEIIGGLSLEKKSSESYMQFLPSIYENHFGANVRDSLEPTATGYYDDLMAFFCDVKTELSSLREGTVKLKRQKTAEGVAKKNLVNYYIDKKRQFDETLSQKEGKINEFQQYIDKFDTYIEKLSKQEIDPQLAEEDKTYLVDYFDIEKLKRSKDVYDKNQAKIQQKAQEIKDEIVQYDNQLKNIEGAISDDYSDLQTSLNDQEHAFADVQAMNLHEFKKMLEEKNDYPTQKNLSDFIRRECEISIPKLKDICQALRQLRQRLEDRLRENASKLKDLISDITNLRVIIKGKIYNKLKVFCSLVDKHEEGIFNLEIIEKFPWVYQQSLNEIKRRGTFKKDYLTVLNILESFGNSENRFRQEFLEMYQQYLPKSFCPFLSKSFPTLRFENIRRMIDQDLNIDFNETVQQSFMRPSSEADILKLLKNLNDNLESKDVKNKELEDNLQSHKDENERLKEQLKQRALNVTNLRKLFGATGFQEKIDDFLNSYKFRFIDKIGQIEKRVNDLQAGQLSLVKNRLSEVIQEVPKNRAQMLEKLDELAKLREDSKTQIVSLTASLQENQRFHTEASNKCSSMETRLEDLLKQKAGLVEENRIKEAEIVRLQDQIKKHEKREKDYMHSKDQQSILLRADLESTKEELRSCQEELTHEKVKVAELNAYNQELTESREETLKQIEALELEIQAIREENSVKASYYEQKSIKDNESRAELEEHLSLKEIKLEMSNHACLNLKSELKVLELNNEELMNQVRELSNELDNMNKRKKSVESNPKENKARHEEIDRLNDTITTLQKDLDEKNNYLTESSTILMDIGQNIIKLYSTILGKHAGEEVKYKEFDLVEMLETVGKFVADNMVKIQDCSVGDKVIAIRSNKQRYLVLSRSLADLRILYIFDTKEDLPSHIMGRITNVEYSGPDAVKEKVDAVMLVKLEDIQPVSEVKN